MQPVAIIGLACRFPGAPDLGAFWRLLASGADAITEVPPDRWDIDRLYNPDRTVPGSMYTRHGGFIEAVECFDAGFFSMSEGEAERVDPQQRLILEVAWHALEHAGVAPDALAGTQTGVFVGISHSDYDRFIYRDLAHLNSYNGPGTYHAIAANRLSYVLDLRGPSMVIDTACSSSLVALHVACQSLRAQDCEVALVGGVQLNLGPEEAVALSRAGALAVDGRCKSFDARADGLGRGEGCGMLVLKLLDRAQRDGDSIHAIIRGSAVNQDGRSNGLIAPHGPAQVDLLQRALAAAEVKPTDVDYIEAHGTGTLIGDAIEVRSIKTVYGVDRLPDDPCFIGSVKGNIGHLEAAAGVAGVIKVVLSMKYATIPAQSNLDELSPYIPLRDTPFRIPVVPQAWPLKHDKRVAGVSAFGFGGTNCHVLLEQPDLLVHQNHANLQDQTDWHILVIRARDEDGLRELASQYATDLAARCDGSLAAICSTVATGRAELPYRLSVVTRSIVQAVRALDAFAHGRIVSGVALGHARSAKRPKIAFILHDEPDSATCCAWQVWGIAADLTVTDGKDRPGGAEDDWLCIELGVQERRRVLETLGELYARGVSVKWSGVYSRTTYPRVEMPLYPFRRRRYWFDPSNV